MKEQSPSYDNGTSAVSGRKIIAIRDDIFVKPDSIPSNTVSLHDCERRRYLATINIIFYCQTLDLVLEPTIFTTAFAAAASTQLKEQKWK